jgi:hypothetical protein
MEWLAIGTLVNGCLEVVWDAWPFDEGGNPGLVDVTPLAPVFSEELNVLAGADEMSTHRLGGQTRS